MQSRAHLRAWTPVLQLGDRLQHGVRRRICTYAACGTRFTRSSQGQYTSSWLQKVASSWLAESLDDVLACLAETRCGTDG